jgi:hypothetical protein
MQYNADPRQSTGYPAPTVPYPGQTPSHQPSSGPNSYIMPGTNTLLLALTLRVKKFLIITGVLYVVYGIIIISVAGALMPSFDNLWFIWIGLVNIIDGITVLVNGILMIVMSRQLSYEIKPLRKSFTSSMTSAIVGIIFCSTYLALVKLICDSSCDDKNYSNLGTVGLIFFIIVAIQSIFSIIFMYKEQNRMLTSTHVGY